MNIDPSKLFDFPNQDIKVDKYTFTRKGGRSVKSNNSATASSYYRVRKGDTLSGIAASKRVSINSLCQLNGIKRTSILRPGQQLRLY